MIARQNNREIGWSYNFTVSRLNYTVFLFSVVKLINVLLLYWGIYLRLYMVQLFNGEYYFSGYNVANYIRINAIVTIKKSIFLCSLFFKGVKVCLNKA